MSHDPQCWLSEHYSRRLRYPNVVTIETDPDRNKRIITTAVFCPACGGDLRTLRQQAAALCPHCAAGVPHHTNSAMSIGGADRHPIYDLHAIDDASGVGLTECLAGDLWFEAEREGRL